MKAMLGAIGVLVSAAVATAQPAAPARASLVVTPAWLAQHLDDADLVVLHVGDRKTYDAGHIRGARFVERAQLAASGDAAGGLTLQMPPADALREHLAALGISDASRVVVYESDDWWSPATRVLFTLDYAGLANVSWVDGGLNAWKDSGQPLTTDVPAPRTGALSPLKTRPTIVDADFVQAHARTPGYVIVDARNKEFYDGSRPAGAKGFEKSGHIPGAVSAPFDTFVGSDMRLKSTEEIESLFSRAGVKPGDTVVTYCHIGQQATAALFAAKLAGHPVLLYDGSFEDWSKRGLPVEK
jgi:thiosulfate/3-mercaptopyruvate sulfurtransferase